MELTLHTECTIDSCHQLNGYDGKCKDLHGHTWKIELWFKGDSSKKDDVGILVDFGVVKDLKEKLDHKNINLVINKNPTAETLTEWIYYYLLDRIGPMSGIKIKVRIYETAVDKMTWSEGGDF
jgi:6-pyruvoyltetrahydropterin/6-carboxytetrahydropterin synthase